MKAKIGWLTGFLLILALTGCNAPVDSVEIREFRLLDEYGQPTAARVRMTDMSGKYLPPVGHTADFPMTTSGDQEPVEMDVLLDDNRRFAYVDSYFQVETSSDLIRMEIVKGFHYKIYDDTLALDKLKAVKDISLEKAFKDLPQEPWYTGDVHVHHINVPSALLEMKAEDLNVCNILISDFTLDHQYYTGVVESVSDSSHLIFYGQEYREDRLGHINLLNLTRNLIEPSKEKRDHQYPMNMEAMDQAHAQGAHVSWAHFAAWPGLEGPLAVIMKKLDAVELLCTIDPFHEPIFVSDVVPEVRLNSGLKLWYRLLNCGFKIPATAGTDKMGNFVTVGANRTYALVEGGFNYQNWIEALNLGRTFVSNSPFISFKVNKQHHPGSEVQVPADAELMLSAEVWSQMPLDRLEIVANGELVAEVSIKPGETFKSLNIPYKANKSVWLAARAYQLTDKMSRNGLSFSQRRNEGAGPTPLNCYYGTLRPEATFSHTSPVYVKIKGQSIASKDDAKYFANYLQNVIDWLEKSGSFPSPEAKREVLDAFELGKQRFEDLRSKI